MRTRRIAVAAVIVLAVVGGARSSAADDAALQQEVSALKQMMLELQTRVSQLEQRTQAAAEVSQTTPAVTQTAPAVSLPESAPPVVPAAQSASVPAASGYVSEEAALRTHWAKVSKQMDQNAVIALLGDPSSRSTLDGRTVWYYIYPGTGRGSVFFTDAGRVSSRQSPFGLGW